MPASNRGKNVVPKHSISNKTLLFSRCGATVHLMPLIAQILVGWVQEFLILFEHIHLKSESKKDRETTSVPLWGTFGKLSNYVFENLITLLTTHRPTSSNKLVSSSLLTLPMPAPQSKARDRPVGRCFFCNIIITWNSSCSQGRRSSWENWVTRWYSIL